MKLQRSLLLAATVGGLAFAPVATGLAQTATPTPSATPTGTPKDHTGSGTFRTSDGNSGTYTETFTVADNVTTDAFVYTLDSSTETSTDTTVTTLNTDGSKLVVFTHLAFGATVPFTSTTTFAAPAATTTTSGHTVKAPGLIGTGTYTAADGTVGTLVSLLTRGSQDTILGTDYTSAAGGLTRELKVTSQDGGGTSIRTLTADAANALTVTTLSRFGGGHHMGH